MDLRSRYIQKFARVPLHLNYKLLASAYSTRQGCAERADELAAAHDGTCCFMMARAEECVIQLAIDTGAYEVGFPC